MGLFVHDRGFYKKVLVIGGPIAAQQIITVGVNMMDTVMLGQLNETALSAAAAATPHDASECLFWCANGNLAHCGAGPAGSCRYLYLFSSITYSIGIARVKAARARRFFKNVSKNFSALYIDKRLASCYYSNADDLLRRSEQAGPGRRAIGRPFGCLRADEWQAPVRGCSTMARAPAFQAGDAGSIPVTRSKYAPVAQLDRATAF